MPTYEYLCKTCGHELEELQSMSEAPLVKCPKCASDTLARVMGGGGALIFKGSGFYLTDYKADSKKSAAKSEQKTEVKPENSSPPPPAESKTDSSSSSDTKKKE